MCHSLRRDKPPPTGDLRGSWGPPLQTPQTPQTASSAGSGVQQQANHYMAYTRSYGGRGVNCDAADTTVQRDSGSGGGGRSGGGSGPSALLSRRVLRPCFTFPLHCCHSCLACPSWPSCPSCPPPLRPLLPPFRAAADHCRWVRLRAWVLIGCGRWPAATPRHR